MKRLTEEEIDEIAIAEADNDAAWEAPIKVRPSAPIVIQAEYRGDYKIHLTFNDGVQSTVDFAQWLDGEVFEPLKDLGYFQRFFLDGGTVGWPNGADVAPETLYVRAKYSDARRGRI